MKKEWVELSEPFQAYTPCAVSPVVLNSTVKLTVEIAILTIVREAFPVNSEYVYEVGSNATVTVIGGRDFMNGRRRKCKAYTVNHEIHAALNSCGFS